VTSISPTGFAESPAWRAAGNVPMLAAARLRWQGPGMHASRSKAFVPDRRRWGWSGSVGYVIAMPGATSVIPGQVLVHRRSPLRLDAIAKPWRVTDIRPHRSKLCHWRRKLLFAGRCHHDNRTVPLRAPGFRRQVRMPSRAEGLFRVFGTPEAARP